MYHGVYCSLPNQKSCGKIKKSSDTNLEERKQTKLKRLGLGGANAHKEQMDSIPDVNNPDIMEYILTRVTNGKKFLFTSIHWSIILTSYTRQSKMHKSRGGGGVKMGNIGGFKWSVAEGVS